MVEVFKTNVQDKITAETLVSQLKEHFPELKFNFSLDGEKDRVLRAEGSNRRIPVDQITTTVNHAGYHCEILES